MTPDEDIDDALDAWMAQWHPTDFDHADTFCPCCGAEDGLQPLGELAGVLWFRCRYCGADTCEQVTNTDTNNTKEK